MLSQYLKSSLLSALHSSELGDLAAPQQTVSTPESSAALMMTGWALGDALLQATPGT